MFKFFTLWGLLFSSYTYAGDRYLAAVRETQELKTEVDSNIAPLGYHEHKIQGFKIWVSLEASSEHPVETALVLERIDECLRQIFKMPIKKGIMNKLKSVSIFVDWHTNDGGAQYHVSKNWLLQNGYIPEKAGAVEISNIMNFLAWQKQNQPLIILHELAHAFHHQVLGYSYSHIVDAYNNALKSKLYEGVSYHIGNGVYQTVEKAYAINNEKEYFAELTEAYFGLNDYFPFNKRDLKRHDRMGYRIVKKMWNKKQVER